LVQDVEYALAAIEARHPDPFHARPRAEFEAEIEALRARGDSLTGREACFGLMRMVALADDSETHLGDLSEIADLQLPEHFEWWSDGLWIVLVQDDQRELFGARVLRIAGRAVEDHDRPSLAPDHLVPMDFADVLAGNDSVLERALELARGGA